MITTCEFVIYERALFLDGVANQQSVTLFVDLTRPLSDVGGRSRPQSIAWVGGHDFGDGGRVSSMSHMVGNVKVYPSL